MFTSGGHCSPENDVVPQSFPDSAFLPRCSLCNPTVFSARTHLSGCAVYDQNHSVKAALKEKTSAPSLPRGPDVLPTWGSNRCTEKLPNFLQADFDELLLPDWQQRDNMTWARNAGLQLFSPLFFTIWSMTGFSDSTQEITDLLRPVGSSVREGMDCLSRAAWWSGCSILLSPTSVSKCT